MAILNVSLRGTAASTSSSSLTSWPHLSKPVIAKFPNTIILSPPKLRLQASFGKKTRASLSATMATGGQEVLPPGLTYIGKERESKDIDYVEGDIVVNPLTPFAEYGVVPFQLLTRKIMHHTSQNTKVKNGEITKLIRAGKDQVRSTSGNRGGRVQVTSTRRSHLRSAVALL